MRWVECSDILLLFFVIIINTVRREKVSRAEISLGLVRGQGRARRSALGYRHWADLERGLGDRLRTTEDGSGKGWATD